jgi:thioredoxin reductase (NADPH)
VEDRKKYDVIIVGGGPAGLTAGIYTARARLDTLLLEKEMIGGQIANIEMIENFPGFPDGISGYDLGQLMLQQAEKHGTNILYAEATGLEIVDGRKILQTSEGEFEAETLILAGAARRRRLGVPGEEQYTGRGVSYCATCDAPLYRDRVVAIAGGGNSAITEALHLAKFASRVIVIHRRDQLRASPILQERAFAEPGIEFIWDTSVKQIEGNDFVTKLKVASLKTGEESEIEVGGIFVSIGFDPDTGFLKGLVSLDNEGHIMTDNEMETSVPGIFAAGDIRSKFARQAITAAGEGATAAISAERYLTELPR